MHDQAAELRQMVLRTTAGRVSHEAPPPPMVTVIGGKGGVGSTTIATNIAVALAKSGQRVVLVDGDFCQPDATSLCRTTDTDTVLDVLGGRRTVHEVLQRGPAGIQVLPGAWAQKKFPEVTPIDQQRLVGELRRLGPHADLILIDAGSGASATASGFWEASQLVLLVSTHEAVAIMDTYAAVKLHKQNEAGPRMQLVTNKVRTAESARDVQRRISHAAQRFLSVDVGSAGAIPWDEHVTKAGQMQRSFVLEFPATEAARSIESVAETVVSEARETANSVATERAKRGGADSHAA